LFIVAVRLNDGQRFTAAVGRLHEESVVGVRIGDPASHLRQEAEVMPAPGVAVVEVNATAVNEPTVRRLAGRDGAQCVDEHPRGHVRMSGARGAPDVDAKRGADDVVVDNVRLEAEPTSLLTVSC